MPVTPRSLRRNNPGLARFSAAMLAGTIGVSGAAWAISQVGRPYTNNMAKSRPRSAQDSSVLDAVLAVGQTEAPADLPAEDPAFGELPAVGGDGVQVLETVTSTVSPILSQNQTPGTPTPTPPPPPGILPPPSSITIPPLPRSIQDGPGPQLGQDLPASDLAELCATAEGAVTPSTLTEEVPEEATDTSDPVCEPADSSDSSASAESPGSTDGSSDDSSATAELADTAALPQR